MKKLLVFCIATMAAAALTVRADDAKTLYGNSCAKCHGDDGKGQTKMGQKLNCKDYSDAKVQDALTDDAGVKAIKEGLKDASGKSLMKASDSISDSDAKALVAYMRTFKK